MKSKPLNPPRLIAWETTRACNLICRHCRAEAVMEPPEGELSHEEGLDLLDQAAAWPPPPMIILSGGEPLMRRDILELASYGSRKGLRMLLSTNGTLVSADLARRMKEAGVARVSLSLDAPDAASHDDFRGLKGAFEGLITAARYLKEAGLPFQINTTLTSANLHQAEEMGALTERLGAVAHHIFLLVPVGRAEEMEPGSLSAEEYEAALKILKQRETSLSLEFKATCAPQYQRIGRQLSGPAKSGHAGRGCMAGQGFLFISSTGDCQGCGYLPLKAGNIRQAPVREIYEKASLFVNFRDKNLYHGKCGKCEYWNICGGCRARAHAAGDHMGPEPLCPYLPHKPQSGAVI